MAHRLARRLLGTALITCSLAPVSTAAAQAGNPFVKRINTVRAAHHLPPLRLNAALEQSAAAQSQAMLSAGTLSHSSTVGALAARLRPELGDRVFGETIAFMPTASPGAVVGAWLRSPPHRAVLLSRTFRRIGIAAQPGRVGGRRVVSFTADLAS